MTSIIKNRPTRSQREILQVLRNPINIEKTNNHIQNLQSDEGQLNPVPTSDLTSVDQFMTDQLLPSKSPETEILPPTDWALECDKHPIKSTVDFKHKGSIIASVEISEFGHPSKMHKWKITSPSISPFQHYMGPIGVQVFRNIQNQGKSISIKDRDVFDGSRKIIPNFTQRLRLDLGESSGDAPLILSGMNVELIIPKIIKLLLTGKKSKLFVRGNIGTLKSKQGLIYVSKSIKEASSVQGEICCDYVKPTLPTWSAPLQPFPDQPQITITSSSQECVLLHDCNLIIAGDVSFIMTSSEDIKIDGCCDSIETVWGNIYLDTRNIQKVLTTTGKVCVPSACDVSKVHSKNIRFVDICEE